MGTAGGTPPHSRLKAAPLVSARAAALLCSQRWPTRQESLSCRAGSLASLAQQTADEAGLTCQDHHPKKAIPSREAFCGSLRKLALAVSARAAESGEALILRHHQPLQQVQSCDINETSEFPSWP